MLSETCTNAFVGLSHWILTGQNSLAALNATTTPQRSTLNFLKNHLVAGSKKVFALCSSAVTFWPGSSSAIPVAIARTFGKQGA